MAWTIVGVANQVEVTAAPHALVTTGISGLQQGDLLVACLSSRIASTTSVTLPTGGEWTLVGETKHNNTATNTTAAASGLMAYSIRGAADPNLTFNHPIAPSVAIGRIVAYRGADTGATVRGITAFSGASLSTTAPNWNASAVVATTSADLFVAAVAGGQEATWSAFSSSVGITGLSGATDTTTAPVLNTWTERADANTTTGADTSLAILDALGGFVINVTATASLQAIQVLTIGVFRYATIPDLNMPTMRPPTR